MKGIKVMDRNSFVMSFHYVYIVVVQGIVTLTTDNNKLSTKLFNLFGLFSILTIDLQRKVSTHENKLY